MGPTGVRRWAWLVLVGSWPVHVVRTMCSAKACCEAVSDPICVLALLLCWLQVCHCYNDERGSLVGGNALIGKRLTGVHDGRPMSPLW